MEKLKRVFARGAKGEKGATKFSALRGGSQGKAPTGRSASGPFSSFSTEQTGSSSSLHGLVVLHAWNSPAVDICFVHGLAGDRYSTWAAKGASAPWPKLLLPDRVERARVLTYGYGACLDPDAAGSATKVVDDALHFLEALAEDRKATNASSRPLILIAHGSGGFLCKKAALLSRAHHDTDCRAVLESLLGVVFIGTPHGGSWIKEWVEIPASVLGLSATPEISLLKALATDAHTLEAIQTTFLSLVTELTDQGRCFEMVSFFEELPSGDPLVKISTMESVTLQEYTALQLGGNHADMAKFGSTDDRGFKRLLGYLLRWTSSTR
ncbi:Alpha/Beta hydrolase protein [Podospora conica]|nr:Alpha/Beta hydrolase protein [Schizothecium conicum]